jgi:hypothetical protein
MRTWGAWLATAVCLTALPACGGRPANPLQPGQATDQWVANAADVITVLERDVLLSTRGGSTLAAARHALHDDSILSGILVAYTDFGGCSHMVSAIGTPPPRFEKIERTLVTACLAFERAGLLFTHAASKSDPHSLLAATRLALRTWPVLAQAADQLEAASTSR